MRVGTQLEMVMVLKTADEVGTTTPAEVSTELVGAT